MLKFILKFVLSTGVVYLLSQVMSSVHVTDYKYALYVALILGLLNVTVKPILKILTFPITILTLGFFLLIINVIIIYIAEKILSPNFYIDGFFHTLIFSILLSIFNSFINSLLEDKK